MKLGAWLDREKIGVREFAERIGVTTEAVRLYVTGQRTPRPKVMERISAETNGKVRANDFFEQSAA